MQFLGFLSLRDHTSSLKGSLRILFFSLGVGTYFGGTLSMIPLSVRDAPEQSREPSIATIAAITLWCIWKARCMHVLSHEPSSPETTLCIIWSELIHTLRSQWDAAQGDSRAAEQRRFAFLRALGDLLSSFTTTGASWSGTTLCLTGLFFMLHVSLLDCLI